MESLYNIVEMARMNKSQIQNGKDELLYQADRLAAKSRKLRRTGKEKESFAALQEAAKLREQAENWKPEVEYKEQVVPYFKLYWTRYYLLSGGKCSHGPAVEGCVSELFTEKLDFINQYANKIKVWDYLKVFKDDIVLPKSDNRSAICNLSYLLDEIARLKCGDVMYEYDKIKDVTIQIRTDDPGAWRYAGETTWRHLPTKKDIKA